MKKIWLVIISIIISSVFLFSADLDSKELAQNLIRQIDIDSVYQTISINGASSMQIEIEKAIGRSISDNEKQRLIFFLYREVKIYIPVSIIEDMLIQSFSKYLTIQEIKDINVFYKTTSGKKLISVMPKITKEGEGIGAVMGQKIANKEFIAKMTEDFANEFPNWVQN